MSKLRVLTPVDFGRAEGGGDARWGLAMTWTNQPRVHVTSAGQTCEPARLDTDIAEAVARELGVLEPA